MATTPVATVYLQDGDVLHNDNAATISSTRMNGSMELAPERAMDELEGALLLPVATHVHGVVDNIHTTSTINNDDNIIAAVPVHTFNYDEALAKEEQEETQQQLQQPLLQQQQQQQHNYDEIAYAIPYAAVAGCHHQHNPDSSSSSGIADDSPVAVKYAQYTGCMRAEQEREAILTANRDIYAQNYWEAQSVYTANDVAKRRDREGLQIQDDRLSSSLRQTSNGKTNNTIRPSDEPCPVPITKTQQGGYDIQHYDIADDYETDQYEVQEYKSIYD
jgi:hypothetical protein